MKSLFLATAAVAALVAAPALAQDGVGSIGVAYNTSELDLGGLEGEVDGLNVDASFATPVTADWTVTMDGAFAYNLDDVFSDDSTVSGRVHGSTLMGDIRVGAFVGGGEALGEQLWSFGGEAQAYMDKVTLTGSVAYETLDGVDVDSWSVAGDAAYFITPDFRLNGGAGWSTVDLGGVDTDGWQANLGGEYQFTGTGFGVTAGYTHSELEDLDLTIDTLNVGLRFSFGGDLQTRQRAGGDLGRTVAGVGSLGRFL